MNWSEARLNKCLPRPCTIQISTDRMLERGEKCYWQPGVSSKPLHYSAANLLLLLQIHLLNLVYNETTMVPHCINTHFTRFLLMFTSHSLCQIVMEKKFNILGMI